MKKGIVWVVFCMMVAVGLVACTGGGGGDSGSGSADTMTVAVQGGAGVTYTEGPYNNQGHLDPILSSDVTPSNTYVALCSNVTQSGGNAICATLVNISIKGNTPGSYPTGTTNSPTQISYQTNNKIYLSVLSSTTGTITLSSVGNVGEKITGTFDALVTNWTNSSETLGISGTFSVERDF